MRILLCFHIKAQYCTIADNGGKINFESEKKFNVTTNIQNNKIADEFFWCFGLSGNKGC